ncbi:Trimethylamine-N-oxide reductase 2 precursor [Serratia fonticola]|uniref:Trimethylamine-N-oxide reductase 2 n=1 Tax=Serratia fonticola TaxID=47917 RepID=A0A4U9UPI2_SERFO|nr:Trimethylamine-N-oxide reductase 2 precursor [Serratia fonticola]
MRISCYLRPPAIERNDLEMGGDYSQLYVFPMHQCVPPQHESRNDFDIFAALAAKLGVLDAFTKAKTKPSG